MPGMGLMNTVSAELVEVRPSTLRGAIGFTPASLAAVFSTNCVGQLNAPATPKTQSFFSPRRNRAEGPDPPRKARPGPPRGGSF